MADIWHRLRFVDGADVSKSGLRSDLESFGLHGFTVSELQGTSTFSARWALVSGVPFVLDAADVTSAHDGVSVIVTADGKRFKRADPLSGAVTTVASAATTNIGAALTERVEISGTTTITSFGTSANRLRWVRFQGALTLTHNGTSLVLPGSANILTAAGDHAVFASDSSGNWRCLSYTRADGSPLSVAGRMTAPASIASAATTDLGSVNAHRVTITGTTTITSFGTAPNRIRFVTFAGSLTLTHNGASLILPGAANIVTQAGDKAIFVSDNSGNWECLDYTRAAAPGGVALIATTTVGSPVATVDFSGIPAIYRQLTVVWEGVSHNNGASTGARLLVSDDGGTSFKNISRKAVTVVNTAVSGISNTTDANLPLSGSTFANSVADFSGVVEIFNANIAAVKPMRSNAVTATGDSMRVQSGFVVSSNPINFIRFSMDAGQIDAGTFRLYGVL